MEMIKFKCVGEDDKLSIGLFFHLKNGRISVIAKQEILILKLKNIANLFEVISTEISKNQDMGYICKCISECTVNNDYYE